MYSTEVSTQSSVVTCTGKEAKKRVSECMCVYCGKILITKNLPILAVQFSSIKYTHCCATTTILLQNIFYLFILKLHTH